MLIYYPFLFLCVICWNVQILERTFPCHVLISLTMCICLHTCMSTPYFHIYFSKVSHITWECVVDWACSVVWCIYGGLRAVCYRDELESCWCLRLSIRKRLWEVRVVCHPAHPTMLPAPDCHPSDHHTSPPLQMNKHHTPHKSYLIPVHSRRLLHQNHSWKR